MGGVNGEVPNTEARRHGEYWPVAPRCARDERGQESEIQTPIQTKRGACLPDSWPRSSRPPEAGGATGLQPTNRQYVSVPPRLRVLPFSVTSANLPLSNSARSGAHT